MIRLFINSIIGKTTIGVISVLFFWVLFFDFQRILFLFHNFNKFSEIGIFNWIGAFYYSIRLDLSTAGFLSLIPIIFLVISIVWQKKWAFRAFSIILLVQSIVCALIHAGEINAYPEWNHKLTGRVFMHLSHPDEVFRTADWGMIFWFIIYAGLEILVAFYLKKWLFKQKQVEQNISFRKQLITTGISIPVTMFLCLFLARGGFQPIPINTDDACYTNEYIANDLSINSTYYFGKSFLLYKRTNIDQFIPTFSEEQKNEVEQKLFNYNYQHDNLFLKNARPNIVLIILESWSGNAIGSMTQTTTAAPHFDKLTQDGLFFSNIYGVSGTSEIGNSSIFSGYPGIPEVAITMQADKHRKIPSLNQDLKQWDYTSAYLFSGDLKYGNIGGYLKDHGFDIVEDEANFPQKIKKGKLNYFDEDLYRILIEKIAKLPEPFMQCGFTGSTHSPYDFPNQEKFNKFGGAEGKFHNSMLYADSCLYDFVQKAQKQPWYDNTLFIFVADHGRSTNGQQNPSSTSFNRIPLLIYGNPLKDEYRGKIIHKIGSQVDIVRTLLYQMGGDFERYRWSKDLMNPNAPEFALHTINRGYGWITPKGNFTYQMENKRFVENTFSKVELKKEFLTCQVLLALIYEEFKKL